MDNKELQKIVNPVYLFHVQPEVEKILKITGFDKLLLNGYF